ncbi:MAG: VCBS repeat-containing protein [Saprospiraceae bacterium]
MKKYCYYILTISLILGGCSEDIDKNQSRAYSSKLYQKVEHSGVHFSNTITENQQLNAMVHEGFLQGAGVGVLDIDNDGLQDLYFAGNMVSDKLYLNKGDLKFEDVSAKAGIDKDNNWSFGVTIVDINNDGFDDVYVCKYLYDNPEKRKNLLYVNNKDLTFTEQAAAYGLDDSGYSVTATFFDFDNDGDLDVYVVNHPPSSRALRMTVKLGEYQYSDRMYKNENGKYVDVSKTAGLSNVYFSLSATVSDIDNDGWQDIYIACDFDDPDLIYKNNGDGTFTNVADDALKHMSNFGMGVDICDIDNDGFMDIFVADMVAEDNYRNKTNMSSMAVDKFWNLTKNGGHFQYMFNALQLNNGNGTFSEIAQMSGVSKTDWSWAPLFIDADHDGYKDLFVTNGILKEIRNKDYSNYLKKRVSDRSNAKQKGKRFDPIELLSKAPSIKIKNKSYRNTGNYSFDDTTDEWGFGLPSWSQGMSYADLDNDGDLDIIINNSNQKAGLFENKISDAQANYLKVKIVGPSNNLKGIGTRITIFYNDNNQVMDITPYRGYVSSSEPIAHFGLGANIIITKIHVVFPGGKTKIINDVKANQTLTIKYDSNLPKSDSSPTDNTMFTSKTDMLNIIYEENNYNDYKREILIPYKLSNLGPFVAVGDVNEDGNDDFYLGGSTGNGGQLYIQLQDGNFRKSTQQVFVNDKNYEDGGALFLDIDNDGDLDLYVNSGSNEEDRESDLYQDRLYINNNGKFTKSKMLPKWNVSTSVVAPCDVNNDGKMDLFVGGRLVAGQYGRNAESKLLINNGSKFEAVNSSEIKDLGMVTGAKWADIDGDGVKELIISGEWMAITVLQWTEGELKIMRNSSLEQYTGLWNTLEIIDIDGDGDEDIIAGNYGTNYKYKVTQSNPLELFVNDFDNNGSNDVYLGYHDTSDGKLYPVRGRQCSSEQMPFVKKEFENYDAFGKATVMDILDGRMAGSTKLKANTLAHMIFLNDGKGIFVSKELPMRAQLSPIYDMEIRDFDKDGKLDILTVGNFYEREIETTRSDAGIGALLKGDGKGSFEVVHPTKMGMVADNDARAVAALKSHNGNECIMVANNNSQVQFWSINN